MLARPDVHGLFLLNSTARYLWNELSQHRTPAEIAGVFAVRFGIPIELALQDIEAAVSSWHIGLLAEPAPPPAFYPSSLAGVAAFRPIDCIVNGRSMRVLLGPGEVWEEIAPRLEPLRKGGVQAEHNFAVATSEGRVVVLRDGLCIGNEENAAGARAILLQAMVTREEPAAILHAGCCGGILLAGKTHSGKSTLCAALMSRGLPYYCDDSAVLDHQFRITPMPFPLALRPGSWPLLDPQFPALKEAPAYSRYGTLVRFLNPVPAKAPAAATALVFVRHDPTTQTRMTPIGEFDSLLALQKSGFWVEHTREGIARFLAWLATTRRFDLLYAELDSAEKAIRALAGDPASP